MRVAERVAGFNHKVLRLGGMLVSKRAVMLSGAQDLDETGGTLRASG